MAEGIEPAEHAILICSRCRGVKAASQLAAALNDGLPAGFVLRAVDCMAGCDHPTAIGLQAPGKATYLFGPIEGSADVTAILAFSHQYRQSADGWTAATQRPKALFDKTLARMPAFKAAVAS